MRLQRVVALVLLACTTGWCDHAVAELTAAEKEAMDSVLSAHEELFAPSIETMTATLGNVTGDRCTLLEACATPPPADFAFGTGATIALQAATYDAVQTKWFNASLASNNGTVAAAQCDVHALRSDWRRAVQAGRPADNSVRYQYYVKGTTSDTAIFPPRIWSGNCTSDDEDGSVLYTPTRRPYYAVGSTGPKNVVVLLDVSSPRRASEDTVAARRLEMGRAAALRVLESVSHLDNVALVPYAARPDMSLTPSMVRGTQANKAALAALLEAGNTHTALQRNTSDNIPRALQAASALLASAFRTDGCAKVIVLLSSGANAAGARHVLHSTGVDVIVLAYYLAPTRAANAADARDDTDVAELLMRRLACGTGGLYAIATTPAEATASVANLVRYFEGTQLIRTPQWTEPYTDAFGQGTIASVVQPVYEPSTAAFDGLSIMDVLASNVTLGNSASTEKLLAALDARRVCLKTSPGSDTLAPKVAALQGDMCIGTAAAQIDAKGLRKNEAFLIFGSVVGPVALLALPFVSHLACKTPSTTLFRVCLATFAVLWAVAVVVFWAVVYTDLADNRALDSVTFSVTHTNATTFPCCTLASCSCQLNNDPTLPTCRQRLAATTAGVCDDGFHCCEESCSDCYCRNVTFLKEIKREDDDDLEETLEVCDTCCSCTRAVEHDLCSTTCATCGLATVEAAYTFAGTPFAATLSVECNHTATGIDPDDPSACGADFLASFPPGSSHRGWVDPAFPNELHDSLHFNVAAFVTVVVLVTASLLPLTAATAIACFGNTQGPVIPRRKAYHEDTTHTGSPKGSPSASPKGSPRGNDNNNMRRAGEKV